MDPKIIEVLAGQRAVVSTRGMLRVVLKNEKKILDEFLSREEADIFVETYNDIVGAGKATAVPYAESYDWQDKTLKRVSD